ncbi:hypothetical protein LX16_5065 [Stackebrandtia albiflava]|uniref:Uncharacterized protein n=1 Tax=Stackebrandtia albiflava TaxID=406432 RepID=A0A562UPN9_9ACTN|nr:hypothetical protein [Stackebrandtia albiflava]TWJ07579.1 hypothetical protein LX16_5065 [Stackebrandtia albiflava]
MASTREVLEAIDHGVNRLNSARASFANAGRLAEELARSLSRLDADVQAAQTRALARELSGIAVSIDRAINDVTATRSGAAAFRRT